MLRTGGAAPMALSGSRLRAQPAGPAPVPLGWCAPLRRVPPRRPPGRVAAAEFSRTVKNMKIGDRGKEFERQFRRTVFTPKRWRAHRSTNRYLRHVAGIFKSRTFRGLAPPLALITVISTWVCAYHTWLEPRGLPPIHFGDLPITITSFALSLLLVFRTDTSYARWAQALHLWDTVRNCSKDLVRQACYWVRDPVRKDMLVRWTAAYSHALMHHVRPDATNLETELARVLLPHEVEAAAAAQPDPTSFVLQVLSELIEQCRIGDIKEERMFERVRIMADAVGQCDVLIRYPVPLGYTRHTSRFLLLWLASLPFAMWPQCGWASVPICTGIAFLLLGIEDIGVQIEEPFSVLPIEDVVADVEREIASMMSRQDVVTSLLQANGIVCSARSSIDGADLPAGSLFNAPFLTNLPRLGSSGELGMMERRLPPVLDDDLDDEAAMEWDEDEGRMMMSLGSMEDEGEEGSDEPGGARSNAAALIAAGSGAAGAKGTPARRAAARAAGGIVRPRGRQRWQRWE